MLKDVPVSQFAGCTFLLGFGLLMGYILTELLINAGYELCFKWPGGIGVRKRKD